MKEITKNGKKYLRFRIGDEFKAISGKGSFNKMKEQGIASDEYDEDKGFIYPIYDGSTANEHIKGYASIFNYEGNVIKVAKDGAEAGRCVFVVGKSYNADHSYYLISPLSNHYFSLFMSKLLPNFKQGTGVPSVKFSDYEKKIIEIPANHAELAKIIKRVNKYKQLSKQLSKQLIDYKAGILQYADKKICEYKISKEYDKYISFRIGDEFEAISGKGSFNKMKEQGIASDEYDEDKGFIYQIYSASSKNNHIIGYSLISKINSPFIKTSISGEPGRSVLVEKKSHLMEKAYALLAKNNNNLINDFLALYFDKKIPMFSQGSAQKNAYFPNYKSTPIDIPANHSKLSKIIAQVNKWEKLTNKTTELLEKQIEGVLQLSLKGGQNG